MLPDIYPAQLLLEEAMPKNERVPFLDCAISKGAKHNRINMYDKTDDFSFKVLKYGYADSNISEKVGYQILYTQIIRFLRMSSSLTNIIDRATDVCRTLQTQGYCQRKIAMLLGSFNSTYQELFWKHGITDTNKYNEIFLSKILNNISTR